MMSSVPCSTYVSEHYLNWMNIGDTELRKATRDRENAMKFLRSRKVEINKEKSNTY